MDWMITVQYSTVQNRQVSERRCRGQYDCLFVYFLLVDLLESTRSLAFFDMYSQETKVTELTQGSEGVQKSETSCGLVEIYASYLMVNL